jgi:CBS domain-containing protein
MDRSVALYFRDELRRARGAALRDAEGFGPILFTLERLGVYLTGEVKGLRAYAGALGELASKSPLAHDIPDEHRGWHGPFDVLYEAVITARNDALHEGAFARSLTAHAVEASLVLEDALMHDALVARDFMVREVVCARWWQPMSAVRQLMLADAFSFLPVRLDAERHGMWHLVSDVAVARYLRDVRTPRERRERLATKLQDAVRDGNVELVRAPVCQACDPVETVLELADGLPVLVVGALDSSDLEGIVTAFDLL